MRLIGLALTILCAVACATLSGTPYRAGQVWSLALESGVSGVMIIRSIADDGSALVSIRLDTPENALEAATRSAIFDLDWMPRADAHHITYILEDLPLLVRYTNLAAGYDDWWIPLINVNLEAAASGSLVMDPSVTRRFEEAFGDWRSLDRGMSPVPLSRQLEQATQHAFLEIEKDLRPAPSFEPDPGEVLADDTWLDQYCGSMAVILADGLPVRMTTSSTAAFGVIWRADIVRLTAPTTDYRRLICWRHGDDVDFASATGLPQLSGPDVRLWETID